MPEHGRTPGNTDTAQVIADSAIRLFHDRGYHGTSIRDIAREANVGIATLFHHHQSKLELLRKMATIDPRILGTWRLKSAIGRDDAGNMLPPPFGPAAMGLNTFRPDGRMMSVLGDGRASLPEGEPRQFVAYSGNYAFDGTTLTTRVDASSDPSRVGGDQVRRVRFENGLMVLSPPRRLFAGIMQHQELTWERIGD